MKAPDRAPGVRLITDPMKLPPAEVDLDDEGTPLDRPKRLWHETPAPALHARAKNEPRRGPGEG